MIGGVSRPIVVWVIMLSHSCSGVATADVFPVLRLSGVWIPLQHDLSVSIEIAITT